MICGNLMFLYHIRYTLYTMYCHIRILVCMSLSAAMASAGELAATSWKSLSCGQAASTCDAGPLRDHARQLPRRPSWERAQV